MKYMAAVLLLLIVTSAQAQIQFWNIADVEDAPLIQARKAAGIRQMLVYRTGEDLKITDSSEVDEAYTYNSNGQPISHIRYKYDWTLKQRFPQNTDSCYYNAAGRLMAFRSWEGYNSSGRPVYELKTVFNGKGQCVKMQHFNLYSGLDGPETVDVFEWNGNNQPVRQTMLKEGKTRDGVRQFSYNKNGALTMASVRYSGNPIASATIFGRDAQGRLLQYQEKTGAEISKTQNYSYDGTGRLLKKTSQTNYGFDDFTEYRYQAGHGLPQSSYLQYSGHNGKSDRRHEYRVYVYK